MGVQSEARERIHLVESTAERVVAERNVETDNLRKQLAALESQLADRDLHIRELAENNSKIATALESSLQQPQVAKAPEEVAENIQPSLSSHQPLSGPTGVPTSFVPPYVEPERPLTPILASPIARIRENYLDLHPELAGSLPGSNTFVRNGSF